MEVKPATKTLIFCTAQFPFGNGEQFIDNEFPFLCRGFEKIIILTTNSKDEVKRHLSCDAEVIRITYEAALQSKVRAILHSLGPMIIDEFRFIKKDLNLSPGAGILASVLGSYAKALEVKDLLYSITASKNIPLNSLYLYSYWMNNLAVGFALFKSENPEVRAISRAHGWDLYLERHSPPYLPFRKFIADKLDKSYCISENGKAYLNNLTGNQFASKIEVSRLGSLNPGARNPGPNADRLTIVSCSLVIPLKRIHLIIEALALVSDIEINWVHFGGGALLDEIKTLAEKNLSTKKNITYGFTDAISNSDILKRYTDLKIDLFINVSETEGLPVSIMEAMSFGIPIIATGVGGVAEIVEDANNGFLLSKNCSASEIKDVLAKFYKLPDEAKARFREQSFRIWNERYNAQKNYSDFVLGLNQL